MGNRVLSIDQFRVTARSESGWRWVEFLHNPSQFGLNIPVPKHLIEGTPAWDEFIQVTFRVSVAPLVAIALEEEPSAQQAS